MQPHITPDYAKWHNELHDEKRLVFLDRVIKTSNKIRNNPNRFSQYPRLMKLLNELNNSADQNLFHSYSQYYIMWKDETDPLYCNKYKLELNKLEIALYGRIINY